MTRSVVLAGLLLGLCAASASAAPRVGFYGCRAFVSKHPTAIVKPTSIVLTCADANEYVTDVRWSSWTATGAAGTGIAHYNDCKPYCAAGHFRAAAATVTLSKPVSCKGTVVFTSVRLRSKSISVAEHYACPS
jgi:hypothetical protein